MAALAVAIGQPADGQQVRRLEEAQPFVGRQAQPRIDLVGDIDETCGAETRQHKRH